MNWRRVTHLEDHAVTIWDKAVNLRYLVPKFNGSMEGAGVLENTYLLLAIGMILKKVLMPVQFKCYLTKIQCEEPRWGLSNSVEPLSILMKEEGFAPTFPCLLRKYSGRKRLEWGEDCHFFWWHKELTEVHVICDDRRGSNHNPPLNPLFHKGNKNHILRRTGDNRCRRVVLATNRRSGQPNGLYINEGEIDRNPVWRGSERFQPLSQENSDSKSQHWKGRKLTLLPDSRDPPKESSPAKGARLPSASEST